jgi:hypothetical protein
VDQLGPWLLAGLVVAAVLEAAVDPRWLAALGPTTTLALVLLVAAPLHLALVGLVPIAAVLLHKGLPRDAALALLVLGPACSLALLRLLGGDAVTRRIAAALRVCAMSLLASLVAARAVQGPLPAVHGLVAHAHLLGELPLALALAALLLLGLFRLGPRLWFGQLALSGEVHADEHHHGPAA